MNRFDHIIVGAGSAGCALAHRLAVNGRRVLLVEAGSAARNPLLHIPLGFAFLLKPHKNNWNLETLPEPGLLNRTIPLPRGKVMGGCSAINGMVYVRGQAEDYDRWAELGNNGWAYEDVLPLFKRSEHHETGANDFHGTGGPLWVGNLEQGNVRSEFPLCDAFINAAVAAGHPLNTDINGATQNGVGFFPHNIRNGKRLSSASAFIRDQPLPNLNVMTDTQVTQVLIENRRAVGIECHGKHGTQRIAAVHDVILCGGAIHSPALLEHSGIGNADILKALGMTPVQHLPGVGENLHDHWNAYIKQAVVNSKTYFHESQPLPMLRNLLRYLIKKDGMLANPAALVAVFYKALADAQTADAQIHFAPAASEYDARGNMMPINGITIASCGLRPSSRGSTHVISRDARHAPAIQVNYLQTDYDQRVAVAAFRKARDIIAASSFDAYRGQELEPGTAIDSDAEILDYIRRTGDPVHHLAGSCKMGSDNMAVVDAQLRVHGIDNLRIADASIMPQIVSGNTHAACVMIGEKCAELLLQSAS